MSSRKALLAHWDKLGAADRRTLVSFAAFLRDRTDDQPEPMPMPQPEPRPETETVVGAIKRLTRVYPMVDRRRMLDATSSLMTQHIMEGREAVEVIDQLEVVFERAYRKLADGGD
jgi:hypothetical protein